MEFSRVYMKDLTDAELSAFWVMMLESGRDEATFYDVPRMAPREFVRWVRGSGVHLWIILFKIFFLKLLTTSLKKLCGIINIWDT